MLAMKNNPAHEAPSTQHKKEGREHLMLWVAMIVGLLFSGVAFAYKVAEFIFAMSREEAKGFADVPITVYFVVASGWLFLLGWCFLTGKLSGQEQAKYEMLAQEEEYERRGE